jgi:hypothetical protein
MFQDPLRFKNKVFLTYIQQKFKRANAYLTPFLEKHYLKDEDVSQIFKHLKWTYDKDESTDLIKTLILRLKKLEIAFEDKRKRIHDPSHPQNNGSTTTCSLMMVAFFLLLL